MADNKALPKYQFERRIDAFLAVFLPDLLGQLLQSTVRFAVPEFPIKKAGNKQSTNVDHVYFDERGRWLFLELKTDVGSIDHGQITTYVETAKRGMRALVDDIHLIRSGSTERGKYDTLLARLARFPTDGPIELLYVARGKEVQTANSAPGLGGGECGFCVFMLRGRPLGGARQWRSALLQPACTAAAAPEPLRAGLWRLPAERVGRGSVRGL